MPSKDLIDRELMRLDLLYRTKKSIQVLDELSVMFSKSLINVSDDEFRQAVENHIQESKFFPVPKEISERVNIIRRKTDLRKKYLPPPQLTQEQIDENIRRCQQIKARISRKWER